MPPLLDEFPSALAPNQSLLTQALPLPVDPLGSPRLCQGGWGGGNTDRRTQEAERCTVGRALALPMANQGSILACHV